MDALRKILGAFRTKKKDTYNLLSLRGGKYSVPTHLYLKFLKVYKNAVRYMTPQNSLSLAWQTKHREYKPITFDLDIIRNTQEEIPNENIIQLAEKICGYLYDTTNKPFGCFLTRKPVYTKTFEKKQCYKTGIHMYVIGIECTKRWALSHYDHIIPYVEAFCKENEVINPATDVLDKLVQPFGMNGMLLNGDFKKEGTERYYIFFRAFYDGGWSDIVSYNEDQRFDALDDNFDMMYSFLTEYVNYKTATILKVDITAERKKKIIVGTQTMNTRFDFETFLKLTSPHTPGQEEYCRIASFLAQIAYDGDLADELCNQYWNTEGKWDRYETSKFIARYDPHKFPPVKIEHIKDYFQKYTTDKKVNVDALLDGKPVVYYNDYVQFMTGVHTLKAVNSFVSQMCSYVFSCKIFTWLAFTEEHQRVKNIRRNISKHPPFTGSDDYNVKIEPTIKDIRKRLQNELRKLIKSKTINDRYKKIDGFIKLNDDRLRGEISEEFLAPNRILMSTIVNDCQLNCQIHRYTDIVFRPYSKNIPKLPHNVINTFPGFKYMDYVPDEKIKVEDTTLMLFLYEVYNFSNPDSKQLNYILDFLAWKIQYPYLRSEKIWAIVSKIHGIGKSSFFHICEFLLGKTLCLFHYTLDSLVCRFNGCNSSKLIHHIDDLHGCANKKDTRKPFPLSTTSRMNYEDKGERRVELDEFSEIIITANSDTPLYICAEDRRQVIMEISPCWKGNKQKIDKLYAEFQNADVGHAWFHFLLNRKIGNFDPKNTPPPLNATRDAKIKCMPTTHRFIKDFFAAADFHTKLYNDNYITLYRIEQCDNPEIGNVIIRCGMKSLYEQYKRFAKDFYNGGVVRLNTFVDQVAEMGLTRIRKPKRIHKSNPMLIFEFGFQQVVTQFANKYQIELEPWYCETDTELFLKSLKQPPIDGECGTSPN